MTGLVLSSALNHSDSIVVCTKRTGTVRYSEHRDKYCQVF